MKLIRFIVLGFFLVLFIACATNPMTGRTSLRIANESELATTAVTQYKSTLAKSKVITNTVDAQRVKLVGEKIKKAAENYYKNLGKQDALVGYNWEFNLIESNQVNAWCMPGGKVAFYTGIMPVCKDETGVAVVMGHEVAHALAGHGNERVSQAMLAQGIGVVIGGAIKNSAVANVFNQLYPMGAQVGILAYGRKQELEADQMGLYLMAMAGYDPREAISFWHRMEALSNGNRGSDFLSTHPNPESRRADMNKHMVKALDYYKLSGGKL